MKFTVLYRYCEGAKKVFEDNRGKAYGDGVNLVKLDKVCIIDKRTKEVVNHAYAFRCKASLINYLRHKAWYGKYVPHRIGWKK